jgi:hypothetical protein
MQIERRRLDSLQLDPDNAREHDKANIDAIKASLEKFGQRKPIVVADGVVIAGNGTMEAAQALGWEEIDTVSADDLDETERRAYAIADNRTAELAKWNEAKLAEALSSVTEDGDAMGEATGFDHQAIVDLVSQEFGADHVPEAFSQDGEGSPYTHKINTPIYEPSGDCPPLAALSDQDRFLALDAEIAEADIDDDIAAFLRLAATRHVRFDYQEIAEFYCHASPEIQRLMENSALVVIDFDKAIELGFVRLTERMRELAARGDQ